MCPRQLSQSTIRRRRQTISPRTCTSRTTPVDLRSRCYTRSPRLDPRRITLLRSIWVLEHLHCFEVKLCHFPEAVHHRRWGTLPEAELWNIDRTHLSRSSRCDLSVTARRVNRVQPNPIQLNSTLLRAPAPALPAAHTHAGTNSRCSAQSSRRSKRADQRASSPRTPFRPDECSPSKQHCP